MFVRQLPIQEVLAALSNQGLRVAVGPFNVRINTNLPLLANQLYELYKDYILVQDEIAELHVQIVSMRPIRRPWSIYVRFLLDGRSLFAPFPEKQALAALEWGINLAIAVRVNHLLILHSAVVEKNGHAILFPAWPGSGKTTLCTALVHRGYRLFSDEFGLMDPQHGNFFPIPRLMSLKNESINVIKDYLPEAVLGQEILNTQKGTVAHVCPPKESIIRSKETAKANWIIFPKWAADAPIKLDLLPDSEAFLLLASNSFNYEMLGKAGFQAITYLIRSCCCYKLVYSNLDDAIETIQSITHDA